MKNLWGNYLKKIPDGWISDPPFISRLEIDPDVSDRLNAYQEGRGSRQRLRSRDPFQTSSYHVSDYKKWIDKLITVLGEDPLVVDLGCGDGRGIKLLLEAGSSRIVALDFNRSDLTLLWNELDLHKQDAVLGVHASLTDPPLLPGQADAVVMLEVAYSLENPTAAYQNCNRWLHKGGYCLVSNPAVGAYFVHALLNQDWSQIRKMVEEGRYKDRVGTKPIDVHLYTAELMKQHAEASGFEQVVSAYLPAAISLLLHALRQSGALSEDMIPLLEAVSEGAFDIPAVYIDILRKVS